ncbi:Kringle domain [Seminavis robusta]|uniref:Kringle domain n=1 Tax=Seminavis robusta TaxID=568900 RepID=A0A9N8H9Y3_9STRA|nr:Kringle domain [Seminavis robusta]|eukprot:Sro222_g091180.1 Kringle domain (5258) ;mRNA; f:37969-55246
MKLLSTVAWMAMAALLPTVATAAPTKAPTKAPSPAPSTAQPSASPSDVPSQSPTKHEAESTILDEALDAFSADFLEIATVGNLDVTIPLIGVSVKDVVGDGGIYAALNFTEFVPEKIGSNTDATLPAEDVQRLLNEFADAQTGTTVQVYSSDESALCPSATPQTEPIEASWVDANHQEMKIAFCLSVPYSQTVTLDTNGLFDASASHVLVETSASMTVTATVIVAAELTVFFDPDAQGKVTEPQFAIDPITCTMSAVDGGVDLNLVLGVLELSSTANADLSVGFTFCFDDAAACGDSQLGTSNVYLTITGSYTIGGTVTATSTVPGLTLDPSADFTISGTGIMDNYVPTISVSNLNDLDGFVSFSPANLLRMLRQIEATIFRLQEHEYFLTTSIPLTDTTFSTALATGSVFLANKYYVAIPQALSVRPKKSRTLLSSEAFDSTLSASAGKTYELVYTLGPDLLANPSDLAAVDDLAESTVCPFTLAANMSTVEDFAQAVVDETATCTINVCRMAEANACTRDDASSAPTLDIRGSCIDTCHVVVDTYLDDDGNDRMYITSVVDADNTTDVVFLSLNEEASVRAGPTNLYGFPLNQAATPELVPRFDSIVDFVDTLANAVTTQFPGVTIGFEYVAPAGDDYGRYELNIVVGKDNTIDANWSPPDGDLGDFGSVAIESASLALTASASFSTGFAIVLGPDSTESLTMLGTACNTADTSGFLCALEETQFNITYVIQDGDPINHVITVPAAASSTSNASSTLLTALNAMDTGNFPNGIATITEIGSNLINIEFDPDISEIELDAQKYCQDATNSSIVDMSSKVFQCADGYVPYKIANSYGLEDQVTSKVSFQLMVAQSKVEATVSLSGSADITANLNDVISVAATVAVSEVGGNVSLTCGLDQYTAYSDWVQDIVSLNNFDASATVDGSFTATVDALAPFSVSASANGYFTTPFDVDFVNPTKPDITFDVDLPNVGDVRFITYKDVVSCMSLTQTFLVGDGSVESCSDGLLNFDLLGKNPFFEKIPILGKRPCASLDLLSAYTDLIDYLVGEVDEGINTTFTALEEKLESALADVVASTGGTAGVTFATSVATDDDGTTTRATLTVDLVLEWSLSFLEELGLSLNDILDGVDVAGDEVSTAINALLGDVIPANGFGEITFDGTIKFQSGIGLERTVELSPPDGTAAFEGTTCFMLGTSGLQMGFNGGTDGSVLGFDGMLGPFAGTFGIDLNFIDGGGPLDGLSLDVSLDPSFNYYLDASFPDRIATPSSFEVVDGVTGLLTKLSGVWAGGVQGEFKAEIPSVDVNLNLGMSFPDIQTLFSTPKIAIFDILSDSTSMGSFSETVGGTLEFSLESFTSLGHLADLVIPGIGDLMLGDGAFSNFVDAVQQFFDRIDSFTFGASGFITSIDIPFLKKKIATSLGAGSGGTSGSSVFKQAGAKIAGAFDDALDTLVGELGGTIAEEVASLLNDVLADYLVPDQEVEPICGCGEDDDGNFLSGDDCPCADNDGSIESIEWKIPLGGAALTFEIPLDFELDTKLALDLNFTQADDEPIVLTIGWSFTLGIGYDIETGLFLDTFPGDTEISIEALLSVTSPSITASLFNFLDANLTDTKCDIAAGFFIDFDKVAGLRLSSEENATDRNYGRMSLSDFKGISTDFFQPLVRAAATFGTHMELSVSDELIGDAANYVPKLSGDIVGVLYKEITTDDPTPAPSPAPTSAPGANTRRLERVERDLAGLGRLSPTEHNARRLMETMRSLTFTDTLATGYDFSAEYCAIPEDDPSTGCLLVQNLEMDTQKLVDVFTPAIEIFVTSDGDGALDELAAPLLPLNDPIPGVSDLTGKEMTILDAGEAYPKAARGVAAVRTFLETYEKIKTFVEDFTEDGVITIADECDVLAGFECTGGLFGEDEGDEAEGRKLEVTEGAHEIFALTNKEGLPISPADFEFRRRLGTCDTDGSTCTDGTFDGDCSTCCSGSCSTTSEKVKKAKCLKEKVKCVANGIDGLSFPFLSDPTVMIGLITGDDFGLVEYAPEALEFALAAEFCYTLYTPPFVELCILLEFSSTLRYGVSLDTKGIREAVTQKEPIKALNSFAIMDLFDDVDEPILILAGSVGLNINANAVFLEVGLTATVGFVATADIFDPFPETSGGLVRPYELITYQGLNPMNWFEFTLSIYFELEMYIRVQIWLIFDKITIYELSYSIREELIEPIEISPPGVTPVVQVEGGELVLTATSEAESSGLVCVSQDGVLGEETIECAIGQKFATGEGVSQLSLTTSGASGRVLDMLHYDGSYAGRMVLTSSTDATFTSIQSPIDLGDVGTLSLNYYTSGTTILSNGAIVIEAMAIQAGLANVKFNNIQAGYLTLPFPEVQDLTTTLSDCNHPYTLDGHTNLVIDAANIQSGCSVVATGGQNEASVLIDFGTSTSCPDGKNSLTVSTSGDSTTIDLYRASDGLTKSFSFGPAFQIFEFLMSECDDTVTLDSTLSTTLSVKINGRSGDDTVTVGDANNGVNLIYGDLDVIGGPSVSGDTLIIIDTPASSGKVETISSKFLDGFLLGENQTFEYNTFEVLDVSLSDTANDLTVTSTPLGSSTYIYGGSYADLFTINATKGDIQIEGRDGDDVFSVYELYTGTTAVFKGEGGDDTLQIDGRVNGGATQGSTIDGATIEWSGGLNDDTLDTYFVSYGESVINIVDDHDGTNKIQLDCADFACYVLSRENFLANIHTPDANTSTIERINLESTATIQSLLIRLNEGLNEMFFDDTMAKTDVYGGSERDEFHIGQKYNSERDEMAGVDDPIDTTLTTQGYLSDGNHHTIVINGQGGGDYFDVIRNTQLLDLNGDSGDDTFVIRSFLALRIVDGETLESDAGDVTAAGGDDSDYFEIGDTVTSYVVNAGVDVDGGTGNDRAVIVGTEADDNYVVTDGNIYGGGLSVRFSNIEMLDVTGEAGNDVFSILSTNPNVITSVYGALGSDTFYIAPRSVDPVISKNTKGHTGVLEHEIASADEEYNGLLVEGIAVNVLDNDELGYIQVVETSASYVLTEDDDMEFDFYVFPTVEPTGLVQVDVGSQMSINDHPYVILMYDIRGANAVDGEVETTNGGTLSLTWTAGDMEPYHVTVRHNPDAEPLSITDYSGLISLDLSTLTEDTLYNTSEQAIQPIYNMLIPRKDGSSGAKSVTIIEPTGETVVAEGDTHGFDATYDIYLRPCTDDMKATTTVNITETVSGQVTFSPSSITGDEWGDECKVTVTVKAINDAVSEGLHFVTLGHTVEDLSGNDILLSDDSILAASNVLVKIHDDDIAGVIIEESNGATATAEIDDADQSRIYQYSTQPSFSTYFEDSYQIRLSKEPSDTVTVTVESIATASDDADQLGGLVSNEEIAIRTTERIQANVRLTEGGTPDNSTTLTFTPTNWYEWQTVYVSAVNDAIKEGVDLLNFPSQPSFLSLIQGPLTVAGSDSPDVPAVSDPLMMPGETDTDEFVVPDGYEVDDSMFYAVEEKQVNTLIINNLDVRGELASVGTLLADQFYGMNMGQNLVVSGAAQRDGIVYGDMSVIEINLGDGVDEITVVNTTEALHVINANGGDDSIRVKAVSGPFVIHGGSGNDTVKVSSDSSTVDEILALLAFDGGTDDSDADSLVIDNTGDSVGADPVLNVTRDLVEVDSMAMPDSSEAPREVFLISLRGATNGSYDLQITESLNSSVTTSIIEEVPASTTAEGLEGLIQDALFPDGYESSCGTTGITVCSQSVKVYDMGTGFLVTFVGERLNQGVSLEYITDNLVNFESEMFQNSTLDIKERPSDIVYANTEYLDIGMGAGDTILNIRGSTATTKITTQSLDDYIFISSEANQDSSNAASVDVLLGWLDYLEEDVTVEAGSGRHRLMMSDEKSSISMAAEGDPAVLTSTSLTNIKEGLGNIYFSAEGGHWSAGVNLWLGKNDDYLSVTSIPANEDGNDLRTTTSIHAGSGDDVMTVDLDADAHPGAVFIANGQAGDDSINGTTSSLPLILFGDDGDDVLVSGSGSDILIGDYGRVIWTSNDGTNTTAVASAGAGGYGDFTDGVVRTVSEIVTVAPGEGGSDTLIMNDGDDVGIGCYLNDTIDGGDGMDILFGDAAQILYYDESTSPKSLMTIDCEDGGYDTLYGGSGSVDYLVGGGFADTIYGGTAEVDDAADGCDLVFGDHAQILLEEEPAFKLISAETTFPECTGGDDYIYLGAGDDIAFGAAGNDHIEGNAGQDIIFGDFGEYDAQLSYPQYKSYITHAEYSGNDTIHGGSEDDIIFGQEGHDVIYGDEGQDDITGGHNILHGEDGGDTIHGGDNEDTIVGDNARILREGTAGNTFPWEHEITWVTFPAPFDTEVIREVRLFDDVDLVQGDDVIYGDGGNDVIWGQRGDDTLHGGEGEDELVGGLGSDYLDGGHGNDIVLGDVGFVVRRFDETGTPRLNSDTSGTTSSYVWHKDIVLEEVGKITSAHQISTTLNSSALLAEDVAASSMMIVANEYSDGKQTSDPKRGGWPTELILFDLEPSHNDVLHGSHGDDILIGQRGDDTFVGGYGNNLIIGDAGTNSITYNMDFPKIYEIYRALSAPSPFEVPQYGAVFSIDYKLWPNQYRQVDSLGSIIDLAVNMDDLQSDSNLLHDIIGVSALETGDGTCLQPMFGAVPGFLNSQHRFHGNDNIASGKGSSIVIGDDIIGNSGFDLSQFSDIETVRERLDDLINSLSVRMSTLEVDTERSGYAYNADADMSVACDTISTNPSGSSLVTGDSLTIMGRTYKADGVDENSLLQMSEDILNRFLDLELVLVDFHFALYEIHHNLLSRALNSETSNPSLAVPLHTLKLADDTIKSYGNDIVIGDSATLFVQADRPGITGFAFEGMDNAFDQNVERALSSIRTAREAARDDHANADLTPTSPFSNQQKNSLPFDDVPFVNSIGTDEIYLNEGNNLAVGDFAVLGGVASSRDVKTADLSAYVESVETLRKRPVASLNDNNLDVFGYSIEFYNERYDSQTSKLVEPSYHGDYFSGNSSSNVIFGDYWTSYGFEQLTSGDFRADESSNAFSQWDNARWTLFAGDTIEVVSGTKVDSQKGSDTITGGAITNDKMTTESASFTQQLIQSHGLYARLKEDLYEGVLPYSALTALKGGYQCVDPETASWIPPFVTEAGTSTTEGSSKTSAPVSSAPVTDAPVPVTDAPVSTAPASSAPATSSPVAKVTGSPTTLVTSSPVTPVTDAPTSAPTKAPTDTPTSAPTKAPTDAPTSAPTEGSPGNANGNSNGNGNGKNKRNRLRH